MDPESLNRRHAQESGEDQPEIWTTPLMNAVMGEHVECVKFLLQAGANMDNEGFRLDSLICALQSGSYEILELLLKYGLGPDFTRSGVNYESRATYVTLAASLGATKELQLLLDYGGMTKDFAYIESSDHYNDVTPATWATFNGKSDSLKILLLNGAIVNFKQDREYSQHYSIDTLKYDALSLPMHFVMSHGSDLQEKFKMLSILYQFGADFSQRNSMGLTPLNVLENDDF